MFGWLFGKKSDKPYPGHVPPRPIPAARPLASYNNGESLPHSEKALLEPLDGTITTRISEKDCGGFFIEIYFDDNFDWEDKAASEEYNRAVRDKQYSVAKEIRKTHSVQIKGIE